MANSPPDHDEHPTHESNAGSPANVSPQAPDDSELDRRNQEKARPRRAAGPPLEEGESSESAGRDQREPPAPTDPSAMPDAGDGTTYQGEVSATYDSTAGLPADHVGPKPSSDELDRRDRLKAGPRRAAGPPLAADRDAERAAVLHQPPPPTDPRD
jgi:hypothetical protein